MRKFTLLIALFFVAWSTFGQDGWTLVNSDLPVGKGVGQISIGMNDNTALWGLAINDDGTIYDAFTRSVDGGVTWVGGTFDAGNGLSQLFAFDADVCWAVFNTGLTQGLYKTEDGGATWVKKGGVYNAASFANVIHFFDDMNGFAQGDAVGGYYELYTTTDGGENWTRVPSVDIPAPTTGEFGITGNYYAVGDNIWWGTNKGRIFRSTDKGFTWAVSETTLLDGEDPATVTNVMWDEMNGLAYKSFLNLGTEEQFNITTDGGVTWTDLWPGGVNFARYIYHVPGTDNTLIGSAGSASDAGMGISISEDGGANWDIIDEGYSFMASAWLDLETGWCGTDATLSRSGGGMYIYGNPPAPTNLEAAVDVLDVLLTWDPVGGGGGTEELIYDNDVTSGAYSYEGFTMATHMSPAGPCKVLSLKFYTSIDPGDNTFNATLFEWEGTEPGTDIVYEEPATAVDGDWMEVDISSQNITFDGDFVAGFGSINETTYVGYDENLDNGRSWDFDNASEAWSAWTEAYLIRAIVEYEGGAIEELGGTSASQNTEVARSFTKVSHPRNYSEVEQGAPIPGRSVTDYELLGYNVFRDGNKINDELVVNEEYMDEDLPISTVEYYVTAMYSVGESDPSNTVQVVITSVIDNEESLVNIYPNPARDMLNIELPDDVQLVTIMNPVGQMVYSNHLKSGKTTIDLNGFMSGVYFIQISTENGKITKRIVIQ